MNPVASSGIAGRFKRVLLFPILAKTEICHLHGRPQIADHLAQLAAAGTRHGGARRASWICSGLAPSTRAAERVSGAAAEHIAADASWRFVSRQSPILAGEPAAVGARQGASRSPLKPRGFGEFDLEPVAFALVAAGHFGAGVAEMLLDMGLLDLGRGGQAGAQRMTAEGDPPLALRQVPAQAGGERARLHQADDMLVREPLRSDAAVLARHGAEQGAAGDPPEPQPGLEQGDRTGLRSRAPADLDLAPPSLAADGEQGALGEDFDPAGAVLSLVRATIEPNDLGTAQTAREADSENGAVAKATQIHLQRRQHGQKLIGEDGGLLQGRASVAAADAGQHGRDMPVADVERLAELAVAPGDSRQPPLEGGDRKLGAAPLDLRRKIEPDRLGIGRRLGEALAA